MAGLPPSTASDGSVVPAGSWVEISQVVLPAGGRAPNVPQDTAGVDFVPAGVRLEVAGGPGAAGGRIGDTDDYPFMYQRQFDDPDGYHYSPFWMKPDAAPTA